MKENINETWLSSRLRILSISRMRILSMIFDKENALDAPTKPLPVTKFRHCLYLAGMVSVEVGIAIAQHDLSVGWM